MALLALALAASTPERPLELAVIGDYGAFGPGEAAVARLVAGWDPELLLTAGDNNYPSGERSTFARNVARPFAAWISSDPAENRFLACPGNHDWRGPERLRPYLDALALPGNERYYSLRRGPVEVFCVDSDPHEPDGTAVDSRQARWLRSALAASEATFQVVVLHHPPYSSGLHGDTPRVQWPFGGWGADLVVSGHDHHYERLELDGLTWIVDGTGGAPLRPVRRPREGSVAVATGRFGALRLQVLDDRIRARFIDIGGEVLDDFTVMPGPVPRARRSLLPPEPAWHEVGPGAWETTFSLPATTSFAGLRLSYTRSGPLLLALDGRELLHVDGAPGWPGRAQTTRLPPSWLATGSNTIRVQAREPPGLAIEAW